jgi:uncharacterized protein
VRRKRLSAILVPGYGGTPEQPLLVALSSALEKQGFTTKRASVSAGGRVSAELGQETAALEKVCAEFSLKRLVLIGRSFGGRVCAYLASRSSPAALVVVGYPIRPPRKRRLLDEEALVAVKCPTLIVQGDEDELGPVSVLKRLASKNKALTLRVIRGAGHEVSTKKLEREIVTIVSEWLAAEFVSEE